jgi:hypothetical protein
MINSIRAFLYLYLQYYFLKHDKSRSVNITDYKKSMKNTELFLSEWKFDCI